MKILLTGHLGYVGSVLAEMLVDDKHDVTGLDVGFYADCNLKPLGYVVTEIRDDIRDVTEKDCRGFDAVIHLAALSNDPLGELDSFLTDSINRDATINLAWSAKKAGVRRFIYASSQSMYGIAGTGRELEEDLSEKNPLTAYARTKWEAEQAIKELADDEFVVVCLRPSTVFGASPYLRSDIVFNNFVGCAYTTGKIEVRSDGTPWRPVVHIRDVSRAFIAALNAPVNLVQRESFNVGVPNGNYTVRELAEAAQRSVPGSQLVFTGEHGKDSRTYKVSFNKILTVLKDYYSPEWDLDRGGKELVNLYRQVSFSEEDFRGPKTNRLKKIDFLKKTDLLNDKLRWKMPKETKTEEKVNPNLYEMCIVGGAGHVGLPLGVVFANAGVKTVLFDVNQHALDMIVSGRFPFMEEGGDAALFHALESNMLFTSTTPEVIGKSKYVLIVIGTPIDEYLSPKFGSITRLIDDYFDYFSDGQVIILRSTVYPGTTEHVQRYFKERGKNVRLAFCPERIMQGRAIEEIKIWPQIVSAFDDETLREVRELFQKTTSALTISTKPIEAELAKLFTNAWRYIRFAVANQFFMVANDHGLDYYSIFKAMKKDYPRNRDLPLPGFAAGPCLLKDTMQLAAFTNNNFWLGHAAMLVNEGLVNHVIALLKREYGDNLKELIIGILGMAYKAENDDSRDSLSFKLKKLASIECSAVLCADSYIQDPTFVSLDEILEKADIVVLAVPHREYLAIDLKLYPHIKFVDVWNVLGTASEEKVV